MVSTYRLIQRHSLRFDIFKKILFIFVRRSIFNAIELESRRQDVDLGRDYVIWVELLELVHFLVKLDLPESREEAVGNVCAILGATALLVSGLISVFV